MHIHIHMRISNTVKGKSFIYSLNEMNNYLHLYVIRMLENKNGKRQRRTESGCLCGHARDRERWMWCFLNENVFRLNKINAMWNILWDMSRTFSRLCAQAYCVRTAHAQPNQPNELKNCWAMHNANSPIRMTIITIIIITKYAAALQINGRFRYHKRGFFFSALQNTIPLRSVLYKLFIVFCSENKKSVFVFLCLCVLNMF